MLEQEAAHEVEWPSPATYVCRSLDGLVPRRGTRDGPDLNLFVPYLLMLFSFPVHPIHSCCVSFESLFV